MAFYSSHVDEEGNELERRHSARTCVTMPAMNMGNSTRTSVSSRSYDASRGGIRFVNPAAFIAKHDDDDDDDCDNTDNGSSLMSATESRSDIVPPLDLQSEENYPTPREYAYSYCKDYEAAKIVLKPDRAYETWLSAKRKILSDEALRRKQAEEQKRLEQEERKRLSDEKFQQWLESKSKQQVRSREKLQRAQEASPPEERPSRSSHLSVEEVSAKRAEWERIKRIEIERRRMLKQQQERHKREVEERRRAMAAEAWERWVAEAANKPKPVPLNRGIFTLRGTVSDIYVNPNEWQPTGDANNNNTQQQRD